MTRSCQNIAIPTHPPVLSFFVWRPVTSLDAAQIEKLPSPVLPLCECVATHPPPPAPPHLELNSSSDRSSSSAPFMSLHGEDDEGRGEREGWLARTFSSAAQRHFWQQANPIDLARASLKKKKTGQEGISDGELRSAGQTEAPPEFRSCIRTSRGMCADASVLSRYLLFAPKSRESLSS